ncbi:MAG: peptidase M23, partial [Microcoleus sp.]
MKPVSDKQKTADLNTKEQKKQPTGARTRKRLLSDRTLLVGLSCFTSLGLLSHGLVWAQTETPLAELTIPAEPEPQAAFEAPPPAEPEPPAAFEAQPPAPEPAPIEEAPPPVAEPEPYVAPSAEIPQK